MGGDRQRPRVPVIRTGGFAVKHPRAATDRSAKRRGTEAVPCQGHAPRGTNLTWRLPVCLFSLRKSIRGQGLLSTPCSKFGGSRGRYESGAAGASSSTHEYRREPPGRRRSWGMPLSVMKPTGGNAITDFGTTLESGKGRRPRGEGCQRVTSTIAPQGPVQER